MLRMGFIEDVEWILAQTPPSDRSRCSRRRCPARRRGHDPRRAGRVRLQARTRPASSRAWPPSWPPTPRSGTISSSCAASRPCAATTRASRARRISLKLEIDSGADARRSASGTPGAATTPRAWSSARRVAGTGVEVRTVEGDALQGSSTRGTGHEPSRSSMRPPRRHARAPCTPSGRTARRCRPPGCAPPRTRFGVADAVELARALGRLPARLDVYAVEGAEFEVGAEISAPRRAHGPGARGNACARRALSCGKPTVAAGGTPARVRREPPDGPLRGIPTSPPKLPVAVAA